MPKRKLSLMYLLIFAILVPTMATWLFEPPLKYSFLVFDTILILSFLFLMTSKSVRVSMKISNYGCFHFLECIDAFFILVALSLILLNVFGMTNNYVAVGLGIIGGLFTPSWALLRVFNVLRSPSVEAVVVPFAMGIPVSSLLLSFLLLSGFANRFLLLSVILAFSILPLIKRLVAKETISVQKISLHFPPILVITVALAFFSFSIYLLYPFRAYVPGSDIVRHFAKMRGLVSAPTSYVGTELWFHLQSAMVYIISQADIPAFQTMMAFLSIFSILSFYMMSKVYLAEMDARLPAIATAIWTMFSGFGWLYFLNQRTLNPSQSLYYEALIQSFDKSYWDVGYGQGWIWLWYRPITLGVTLLFILLYLLKCDKISKRTFYAMFIPMLLSMNFVHFSEAVVFVLFLFVLSLIRPKAQLRLKQATISSAVAMIISFPLVSLYGYFGMTLEAPTRELLFALTLISILSLVPLSFDRRPSIGLGSALMLFIVGVFVIYVWLLLTWLSTTNNFSVANVSEVFGVPWQFYPEILGIAGLFAILTPLLTTEKRLYNAILPFFILMIFTIFLGRTLTFINVSLFNTGYWERRLLPIAYAAASAISSIFILRVSNYLFSRKKSASVLFLGCIVVFGTMSNFLTLQLQMYNVSRYSLNSAAIATVNELNALPADKIILTFTQKSYSLAEFSPSSWLINAYRYPLWSARYPELPLNVLYSSKKPVYLFVTPTDLAQLERTYGSSFIRAHFLRGTNGSIISLPTLTPPSPASSTVLVTSGNQDPAVWYAYDVLSLSGFNYTSALLNDISTISKATTLVAPTEDIALQLLQYRGMFNLKFNNLIVLNLNGYGELADEFFSGPKMNLSLDQHSRALATIDVGAVGVHNLTRLVGPMEFVVRSTYTNGNMLVLLGKNTTGWRSSGLGSGNISAPILSLSSAGDDATVRIDVTTGNFSQWQISKSFVSAINAQPFDFISFYWYGRGDGRNYVLQFNSGSQGYYWYYFKDSWKGWKKVLIPMNIPDGSYNLNGVFFVKATSKNATWSKITAVYIRNEARNLNVKGTFLIRNLGFEVAQNVTIIVSAPEILKSSVLYIWDGKIWRSVAYLELGKAVSSNFTTISGVSSTFLYGERPALNATSKLVNGSTVLRLSVKLPPYLGDTNFSSLMMRINPVTTFGRADKIVGENNSVTLPQEVSVTLLTSGKEVAAWYKGRNATVPFSVKGRYQGVNITYINIYPLIMSKNADNYSIMKDIVVAGISNLIEHSQQMIQRAASGSLAAFQSAEFDGNVTLNPHSSPIIESGASMLSLNYDSIHLTNITNIIFLRSDLSLLVQKGNLSQGKGFYAYLDTNNLSVVSNQTEVGPIFVRFLNGTLKSLYVYANSLNIKGSINLLLRQPHIRIEGNISLSNLYTFASLAKMFGINGYSAKLEGEVTFNVTYADTFTVANDFSYRGTIHTDYKIYSYDEVSPLVQSLPFLIIIAMVLVISGLTREIIRQKTESQVKRET